MLSKKVKVPKVGKRFNVSGLCIPEEHYMVDISQRLEEIEAMVESGEYFTINRGRQYGKTTTISLLKKKLAEKYLVFTISFEGLGDETYFDAASISRTFCGLLYDTIFYKEVVGAPDELKKLLLESEEEGKVTSLRMLSNIISRICMLSEKPVILIIDEVDQASNHKVFLDFLGVLRDKYLKRESRPTFRSVILAGVYDIKNLKLKMRDEAEHQYNSPWNIASDFNVDMSLSVSGIAGMLADYERDHETGMDIKSISNLIYDYTSGYPYLVSRICKIIDEYLPKKMPELSVYWTRNGVVEAVRILLSEQNSLFDDMRKKLSDFPELRTMFYEILYNGKEFPYNYYQYATDLAKMFGYITDHDGKIAISNRIFETWLYNLFVSEESLKNSIYSAGAADKSQFISDGQLNMEKVLERFIVHYTDLYGDKDEIFHEKEGRKYFLFYLKPIINGTGNYYVEAQTRDEKRTDVIVDYCGEQFIVEMKIWRGEEYNHRGEEQLTGYLDAYHLNKGYMLSFNFNKKKNVGMKEISVNRKTIIEAVV